MRSLRFDPAHFKKIILFICLFLAVLGLCGCTWFLWFRRVGFSLRSLLLLPSTGSRLEGFSSWQHMGFSCSGACGIFPDQGSNSCLLCWRRRILIHCTTREVLPSPPFSSSSTFPVKFCTCCKMDPADLVDEKESSDQPDGPTLASTPHGTWSSLSICSGPRPPCLGRGEAAPVCSLCCPLEPLTVPTSPTLPRLSALVLVWDGNSRPLDSLQGMSWPAGVPVSLF